jgi:hypothetical protein
MSPALFISVYAAALIISPLLWLVFKYFKAPNPRAFGLFACAALWLLLTVFVTQGLQLQSTRQGEQVAPAAVPMLKVPSNATNICYRYAPLSSTDLLVQFTLNEPSFLQWMAAQGYAPVVPIDANGIDAYPVPTQANPQAEFVVVKNGLIWNDYPPDDDCGSRIIFDRDTGTVYYISTTR